MGHPMQGENMRVKRFALASVVLFFVSIAWAALVHLVVLRATKDAVHHLWRTDLTDKMWLSFVVTAGMVMVFIWGYSRFARNSSVREALTYGIFFGLITGILVDLNQYVLYPIHAWVAVQWFLAGLVEFWGRCGATRDGNANGQEILFLSGW